MVPKECPGCGSPAVYRLFATKQGDVLTRCSSCGSEDLWKPEDAKQFVPVPEPEQACFDASEAINNYIESLDIADDTSHPLWPTVLVLRAVASKACLLKQEGR